MRSCCITLDPLLYINQVRLVSSLTSRKHAPKTKPTQRRNFSRLLWPPLLSCFLPPSRCSSIVRRLFIAGVCPLWHLEPGQKMHYQDPQGVHCTDLNTASHLRGWCRLPSGCHFHAPAPRAFRPGPSRVATPLVAPTESPMWAGGKQKVSQAKTGPPHPRG